MSTLHPSYHIWYSTSTSTWCSLWPYHSQDHPAPPGDYGQDGEIWPVVTSCSMMERTSTTLEKLAVYMCFLLYRLNSDDSFYHPKVENTTVQQWPTLANLHCLVGACVLWTKVSKMDKIVSWRISAEILMNFWPTLKGSSDLLSKVYQLILWTNKTSHWAKGSLHMFKIPLGITILVRKKPNL